MLTQTLPRRDPRSRVEAARKAVGTAVASEAAREALSVANRKLEAEKAHWEEQAHAANAKAGEARREAVEVSAAALARLEEAEEAEAVTGCGGGQPEWDGSALVEDLGATAAPQAGALPVPWWPPLRWARGRWNPVPAGPLIFSAEYDGLVGVSRVAAGSRPQLRSPCPAARR
mgnify:CR=1 FL=1